MNPRCFSSKQPTRPGGGQPAGRANADRDQFGRILHVGPGRVDDSGQRIPRDVAEGDVVIFSKYGGTEVKYDGNEYLLLNARDILAVVSK